MLDGTAASLRVDTDDRAAERARCPECGQRLLHRGGCVECGACGYSTCG